MFVTLLAQTVSAVDISGTITTTTWRSGSVPYVVSRPVTVLAEHILTIEPGVNIVFRDSASISIEGTLHAIGTADSPILFNGLMRVSGMNGIQFLGSSTGVLDHVHMLGSGAISEETGRTTLNASTRVGRCMSIDGHTMTIGGQGARPVVLTEDAVSGQWSHVSSIGGTLNSPAAVNGDVVVVGYPWDNVSGAPTGAGFVAIYNRTRYWQRVATLVASDPKTNSNFGVAVDVDGDALAVGAWRDNERGIAAGAAYVFQHDVDGWHEVRKLLADDGDEYDDFGVCLAIDGDYIVVGARYSRTDASTNGGATYVFYRHQDGENNWGQVAKLTADDGGPWEQFGKSVAISGDIIAIGAVGGGRSTYGYGAVFVFQRVSDDSVSWHLVKRLNAAKYLNGNHFGEVLSIDGDHLATQYDGGRATIVFERNRGGWNNWGQLARFRASDWNQTRLSAACVGIRDDLVVVGADGGGTDDSPSTIYQFSLANAVDLSHTTGGAGLSVAGADVQVSNSVVSGFSSGVSASGEASVTLTNCTITSDADTALVTHTSGTITAANCIISGAVAPLDGPILATYSCLSDTYSGVGNITADPRFADISVGDCSLLWGSPCIDTGDPSLTDPDGTRSDMGALVHPHGVGVTLTLPTRTVLYPNSPNPFNPTTNIRYDVKDAGVVRIVIHNVLGQRVRTLVSGYREVGSHSAIWDGRNDRGGCVTSGVYLCRMIAGGRAHVRRMMLVK